MRPVSKWFYLGSIYGSMALSMLLSFAAIATTSSGRLTGPEAGAVLLLNCTSLAAQIYGFVVWLVLVYRMWTAIQDGNARTTPGLAVGLLFVPLFNLYWTFQVYWGWARDFNAYVRRKALAAPWMPEGVALTICILGVVASLAALVWFADIFWLAVRSRDISQSAPSFGHGLFMTILLLIVLGAGLVNAVLTFFFYYRACDGINALVYRSARGVFGETKWADACNICGAKLRGAEQMRRLCSWCQKRAG